ncbi:g5778 [Coccomyxa elongata]
MLAAGDLHLTTTAIPAAAETHHRSPYTVVCVYAPSVAAERPPYFTQFMLPSIPADRHLFLGGDFNFIAGQRAFSHIAMSGQSAARLDRWLISEQLSARVSKGPQVIGHMIGYPGDHLGVSRGAPVTTLYGVAVWRLPLHLIDDQAFCDRIAEEVPAYLAAYPSDQS